MADLLRFTITGCGSSPGVPRPNGDWGKCDPGEPRNRRLRCGAIVERFTADGSVTRVAIDTGPDFRQQMITCGVQALDGVVYTHAHADHIHGIDDLRSFFLDKRELVDIWADDTTMKRLEEGFGYVFRTPVGSSYPPILKRHPVNHYTPFDVAGEGGAITFEPLTQDHGDIKSIGYRIGPLAYCPDVIGFPDRTVERLRGLDMLIIDALQPWPHPSHFSLDQALGWIENLEPARAVLTHMHTPMDYQTVMHMTPENVEPAYDGMTLEFEITNG